MRLLIADTAKTRRAILKESLAKIGFAPSLVEEAGLGDEALKIISRPSPKVEAVIADWDLPGAEGPALLEKVRALPVNSGIPVLFIVYEHRRADAKEAVRLGARDYLVRPFTDEDLRSRIRGLEEKQTIRKTRAASEALKGIASAAGPSVDLPFLMTLPSAIMKDLLKLADKREWDAGSPIHAAGQPVDHLYLVTLGEVDLLDASGRIVELCKTGDPFLEMAFINEQKAPHTAKARTWTQGVALSRVKLADLMARQPLTSMHLSALVARRAKAATAASAVTPSEFQGNLSSMGFSEVMQILQLGRKTGVLELVRGEERGGIEMESGEARHAWTSTEQGDAAFYALACWDTATFGFSSGPVKHPKTLETPTMSLLMEAMRRHDEGKRPPGGEGSLESLFGGG